MKKKKKPKKKCSISKDSCKLSMRETAISSSIIGRLSLARPWREINGSMSRNLTFFCITDNTTLVNLLLSECFALESVVVISCTVLVLVDVNSCVSLRELVVNRCDALRTIRSSNCSLPSSVRHLLS